MDWHDELDAMWREAHADLALYLALIALRRTEGGGSGREFGVLSQSAPLYTQQLRVARISIKNYEDRFQYNPAFAVRDINNLYTDDFLTAFSHKWAPLKADNDPHGLNANHATNFIRFYHSYRDLTLIALTALPGFPLTNPPKAA